MNLDSLILFLTIGILNILIKLVVIFIAVKLFLFSFMIDMDLQHVLALVGCIAIIVNIKSIFNLASGTK